MSTISNVRDVNLPTTIGEISIRYVLSQPTYCLTEAARLLRIAPSTLRRWLEGEVWGPKRYLPILRSEPTGDTSVSWGEFIEAAFLREHRKNLLLRRLRPFREMLSREFDTPFPFAVARPLVSGRELVLEIQDKLGVPEALWKVADSGQLMLSTAAAAFWERVVFDEVTGEALRHKVMNARNPVYVDPLRSFGIPTVRGIRTEIITELSMAGEPPSVIAAIYRDYGVTEEDVKTAITFETRFLKAP